MAFATKSKLVFLHDNVIRADKCNVSSDLTTVTNHADDNLKYDDPGRFTKGTSGLNGTITFTFTESVRIGAIGFIRHNLWESSGAQVVQGGNYGSGTYSGNMEGNFALLQSAVTGPTNDTLTITISGTSGNTYIGAIWAGDYTEASINARDGGMVMTGRTQVAVDDSAAGTEHIIARLFTPMDASYFTKRAKIADVRLANQVRVTNNGRLVGIVPPHEVDNVGITAVDHAFGYVQTVRSLPRQSFSGDRRYDMQVDIRGV